MAEWTPGDWGIFLTALVAAVASIGGTITTILLQLRGNAKVDQAKAISADTNQKTTAIVRQTNELARADPNASSAPTDMLVQRGPAVPSAQRSTDPVT